MVRVNKTNRVQKFRVKAWENFFENVHKTSSAKIFLANLQSILTPSEILMLEKRLIISLLIKKGVGCREIGRLIDVSPNTVISVKRKFAKKTHRFRNNSQHPTRKNIRAHRSSKGIGADLWKYM